MVVLSFNHDEILRTPWKPPAELRADSLNALGESAALSLASVLRLLAFGRDESPTDIDELAEIARRKQAATAIFHAAREDKLRLTGRIEGGSRAETIPPNIFYITEWTLSDHDNAIEPDKDKLSDAQLTAVLSEALSHILPAFSDETFTLPARWLEVSINRSELANWLKVQLGDTSPVCKSKLPSDQIASEAETSASKYSSKLAIKNLKSYLEQHPDAKREDAEKFVKVAWPGMSGREFSNKVWPSGRELAGLPRLAPPGRKSKSSR